MPRSFSSFRRSVSQPVSDLTRAVLPWSMWPAVPRVMLIVGGAMGLSFAADGGDDRGDQRRFLAVEQGSRVEEDSPPVNSGDDRRRAATEPQGEFIRRRSAPGGRPPAASAIRRPGSEPPPTWLTPATTVTDAPSSLSATAAAIRWACSAMSPRRRPNIRSVGTSRSAAAGSRNSESVASRAASVSLPTRTIRAIGFLRIARSGRPGRG